MTDINGNVVNTYAYEPFGRLAGQGEAVSNPFKYVGRWGVMEEGNNLYYMRARYYDSSLGRFITRDPIGFTGGSNLYGYVGANPVNYIDPLGLFLNMRRARELASEALEEARDPILNLPGQLNGPADAFRHCLWSCKMTEELGILDAWLAGTSHEYWDDYGAPQNQRCMDLNNNCLGRQCGRDTKDKRSCKEKCLTALFSGKLTTIDPPNQGAGSYK